MPNQNRRLCWINLFIIIALFGLLSTQAIAASFDCNKAATWLEKTVCSDEVLSQFDDLLAKAYSDALASLSPEGQKETKEYQKKWLKEISPYCKDRLKAKRDDNATQCFKDAYKKRIKQLQQRLIRYPDRIFRNVHVTQSGIRKTCGFIERESSYPQIENPRDENEKSFNNLISKKASDNLGNPTCSATNDTNCESECVDIDAKITIKFNSKRLISWQSEMYWYGQGAAHGYTNIASFHWLLEAKRELQATDLFDSNTDWRNQLTTLVTQQLKEQEVAKKKTYKIEPSQLTDKDELCSPEQWVLTQDGLGIQYAHEYDRGSRVALLIKIDWKTIDPYLSKNGRSLISEGEAEQPSEVTATKPPLKQTTLIKAVAALPKTGQTTCYDIKGKVIDCQNTGQDGELQKGVPWPEPRFTDNGNQTVTDNLTGLMWTKDGNAPGPASCSPAKVKTWQQALDYATCLNTNNYLGHTDWRLPNEKELRSLVNYGQANSAAWLNTQKFTNVQSGKYESGWYWSSTIPASDTADAWFVSMPDGELSYNNKKSKYYAWPVRSEKSGTIDIPKTGQKVCYSASGKVIACMNTGQDGELQNGVPWPKPRFTDNGDQTLTDKLTGLMWTKDGNAPGPAACEPGQKKTWQQAFAYVVCLNTNNYLGHNDWRVPNINELESLVHAGQADSSDWLYAQGFANVQDNYYWSSTTTASRTDYWAWGVYMRSGGVSEETKTDNCGYVWPVRAGK